MLARPQTSPLSARIALGIGAAVLFLSIAAVGEFASARVEVAPWSGNLAGVTTKSEAGSVVDQQSSAPPGPASWAGMPFSSADNDTTDSHAFANMYLSTSFGDSVFGIQSSGFGSADGPGAKNGGGALVFVWFYVPRTQNYIAYPVVGEGNFASRRMTAFLASGLAQDLQLLALLPGPTQSGRLAPGLYFLYYENYYKDETENGSPNAASIQVAFYEVPDPLIGQHPQSQTVAPGATASFSVGASGTTPLDAPGLQALTYRWRRNYVNLSDGGRISGATTNHLVIANVAVADTGVYDCIVTDGPTIEPSSLARLTVTGGNSDVEPLAIADGLALASPIPSPFRSNTLVRFALPHAAEVRLEVLDVSGRRVRTLVDGESRAAGAHAVEWNGTSDRGERLPSGIYFVRLAAGTEQRVRRTVRLAP